MTNGALIVGDVVHVLGNVRNRVLLILLLGSYVTHRKCWNQWMGILAAGHLIISSSPFLEIFSPTYYDPVRDDGDQHQMRIPVYLCTKLNRLTVPITDPP